MTKTAPQGDNHPTKRKIMVAAWITAELYEALLQAAKKERRSISNLINVQLEESLAKR